MVEKISKFVVLMSLAASGVANAGLIGDTIHVAHNYPLIGQEAGVDGWISADVTVASGNSDLVNLTPFYSVDADDSFILVDFGGVQGGVTRWASASFNGLVVSDISSQLSGFAIDTNLAGWSDSRFTSSSSFVAFDWNGLFFNTDSYFRLSFDGTPTSVPEPATLSLFGLALVGLGMARRKRARV